MTLKDQDFPSFHPKQSDQSSSTPRIPTVADLLSAHLRQDYDQAIEMVVRMFLSKNEAQAGIAVRIGDEEGTTILMRQANMIPRSLTDVPANLPSSPSGIQQEDETRQRFGRLAQRLERQLNGLKETGNVMNQATRDLTTGLKRLNRGMSAMKYGLDQLEIDSSVDS